MIRSFTSLLGDESFEFTPEDQRLALKRLWLLRGQKVFRVKSIVFSNPELRELLNMQLNRSRARPIWELIRFLSFLRDLRALQYSQEFLDKYGRLILEKQLANFFRNRNVAEQKHVQILANYMDWSLPDAP